MMNANAIVVIPCTSSVSCKMRKRKKNENNCITNRFVKKNVFLQKKKKIDKCDCKDFEISNYMNRI